jgi:hypothetical protein
MDTNTKINFSNMSWKITASSFIPQLTALCDRLDKNRQVHYQLVDYVEAEGKLFFAFLKTNGFDKEIDVYDNFMNGVQILTLKKGTFLEIENIWIDGKVPYDVVVKALDLCTIYAANENLINMSGFIQSYDFHKEIEPILEDYGFAVGKSGIDVKKITYEVPLKRNNNSGNLLTFYNRCEEEGFVEKIRGNHQTTISLKHEHKLAAVRISFEGNKELFAIPGCDASMEVELLEASYNTIDCCRRLTLLSVLEGFNQRQCSLHLISKNPNSAFNKHFMTTLVDLGAINPPHIRLG